MCIFSQYYCNVSVKKKKKARWHMKESGKGGNDIQNACKHTHEEACTYNQQTRAGNMTYSAANLIYQRFIGCMRCSHTWFQNISTSFQQTKKLEGSS